MAAPARSERNPVREAVIRFTVSGLVAVTLVSLLGVELFRRTGRNEAIRDAKELTCVFAEGTVEPALSDRLLSGDARALGQLAEALRNIVKHAEPRHVKVAVARRDGLATLEVEDDGKGFDPAASPDGAHFGLRLLADLVRDVGGSLDIDSSPGAGTRVRAEVGAANAARG